MRILALDAALETASAAWLDGADCRAEHSVGDSRQAAATLPPVVAALLRQHGPAFDAVAVTTGPGSFTGLRASVALAHGLALAAGVPLFGLSVADVLFPSPGPVWLVLESRRAGRVFLARGGIFTAALLDSPPVPPPGTLLAGTGAALLAASLLARGVTVPLCAAPPLSAAATGAAAFRQRPASLVQPLYIDPPQARPTAQRPSPA